MLRIALDLDDTVFVWRKSHEDYFHCKISKMDPSIITAQVNSIKNNKELTNEINT